MADKRKYTTITNDAQILSCRPVIESIEYEINKVCKNSFYKFGTEIYGAIESLLELKQSYIDRYNDFNSIMQFFKVNERRIIIDYFGTIKSAFQLSEELGISVRTFFRRIDKLNTKYLELKSRLEEVRNEESRRNNSDDRAII